MTPGLERAWTALEPPFRRALELAWRSCAAGTIGVGSVITSSTGEVIAEGRNRSYDPAGGDDRLQDTLIAHAEMNALALVPTRFSLADCVL